MSKIEILPIHTLNARGNVFLEVLKGEFNLTATQTLTEIQALRMQLVDALKKKGIVYDELRSALVPDRERSEIALIFDSTKIQNSWYGLEVFNWLIPLLDKHSSNSILVGDYIGSNENQSILYDAFCKHVVPTKHIDWKHSSQFFIVYINNLSEASFNHILASMDIFSPCVGYADTTYNSTLKILLSTMLTNLCVKHKKKIIQGHEDDVSNDENRNMSGYPFQKNDFECVSVQSILQGIFLSYKIESPVFNGFESDTEFAINSVNTEVFSLDQFYIVVEDAKLEYLKSVKKGSLFYAGISSITAAQLAYLIRRKIHSNYIYEMSCLAEHGVTKFNIIIEFTGQNSKQFKIKATLEYRPTDKKLRLITLY
jgi:hypothetical protein